MLVPPDSYQSVFKVMELLKTAVFVTIIDYLILYCFFCQNIQQVSANIVVPVNEDDSREFFTSNIPKTSGDESLNHLPNEVFYSTSGYTLNISVKLAFYGDYIASDFDYIRVKPKYGPKLINTCGHFVHKTITPRYTILVSFGGLSSFMCSKESVKFFRKFVNYISSIYGTEMVNASQFIFINWFSLVYRNENSCNFYKIVIKYWSSTPRKEDVIVPAVSTAAFINKLHRMGVIPSLSDTGAYGLCIGSLNIALASLLLKDDIKVVVLNAPTLFKEDYIKEIVDNSLNRELTTKYFLLCGVNDRLFHYKRHGRKLSKFIYNYSSHVKYIKLNADHRDLVINYMYTGILIIASTLLNKGYSIRYIKTEDYVKIPKKFSPRHWFRYLMHDLNKDSSV